MRYGSFFVTRISRTAERLWTIAFRIRSKASARSFNSIRKSGFFSILLNIKLGLVSIISRHWRGKWYRFLLYTTNRERTYRYRV